ncbi:hypothetical protein GCM10020229_15010 [Kitasatospora albolonga]
MVVEGELLALVMDLVAGPDMFNTCAGTVRSARSPARLLMAQITDAAGG